MLIGISGLAGAGKDTAADFLVRGRGFVKVGFADVLKRICRDVYGFSREQLWGPSEMRNAPDTGFPRAHTWADPHDGVYTCSCCGATCLRGSHPDKACYLTPRFALQQLGSEWGRLCYPPIWIDYVLRVADKLSVEGGYTYDAMHGLEHTWRPGDDNWKTDVVISDVRFKNEVERLKLHGAKLIRIVRPGAGLTGAAAAHGSEADQATIPDSAFDVVIRNDKTIVELCGAIDDSVTRWCRPRRET